MIDEQKYSNVQRNLLKFIINKFIFFQVIDYMYLYLKYLMSFLRHKNTRIELLEVCDLDQFKE